ncbi:J domain-containing protein [Endozoicomonas ascidiicola]|uniref:J domain-containing protein n=1 Tax=Endozoicomonas ascidiicola TaxID=1698521 RepID=UPI000829902D|nr:J domain-containing protein [Endozoicomonas ascidiicola]
MQDHYKILGLTPDVEKDVIKAAYRALCKKYHPDKYTGDVDYATEMMKKINIAYEVLSDTEKRKEFDKDWGHSDEFQEKSETDDKYNADLEINTEWDFAIEYYPEIEVIYSELFSISPKIAYAFKILIVDKQDYGSSRAIANKILNQYLEKYFGSRKIIQDAALKYIREGNRSAAKELNRAVKVFGANIDEYKVLSRMKYKHPFKASNESPETGKDYAELDTDTQTILTNFVLIGAVTLFSIFIFSIFT